mmetsp:Transcript_49314/g.49662  ORF Transcript_49314/g.49662 Transcript_49314/m.49662 type:complete len:105 (+) Transcript_49314:563-877(+)
MGFFPGGVIAGVDAVEEVLVGGALVKGSAAVVSVAIARRHELELWLWGDFQELLVSTLEFTGPPWMIDIDDKASRRRICNSCRQDAFVNDIIIIEGLDNTYGYE